MRRLALGLCFLWAFAVAGDAQVLSPPLPYFTGGSDAGELRSYLNQLVGRINSAVPVNGPRVVDFATFGGSPTAAASANSDAMDLAIAAVNANQIRGFYFVAGIYQFARNFPKVTTANAFDVYGAGESTLLQFPVSAPSSANSFFVVGDDTHRVPLGSIHDMELDYQNAPDANSYAIDIPSATDFFVYNIRMNKASSWFRIGSATAALSPVKIYISNITGTVTNGLNNDCNVNVIAGSNLYFSDWTMDGNGVANSNATGKVMCLIPNNISPPGLIDIVSLHNVVFQVWNNPATNAGKPYGLYIDTTNGNVNNVSATGVTEFDHTSVAALWAGCTVGGTGYAHVHKFDGIRLSADSGQAILLDANCNQYFTRVSFVNAHPSVRTGETPIVVKASHDGGTARYQSDLFLGTAVEDISGSSVHAAFEIGSPGWLVNDTTIGRFAAGTTGFQYLYSITDSSASPATFGLTYQIPSGVKFMDAPFWGTGGLIPVGQTNTVNDSTSNGAVATGNNLFTLPTITLTATNATAYNGHVNTLVVPTPIAGTNVTISIPVALAVTGGGAVVLSGGPINGAGTYNALNASGPQITNLGASATIPSLVPRQDDVNTGFGAGAVHTIDVDVQNVDMARWSNGHFYGIGYAGVASVETGYVCYNASSTPANEFLLDTTACLASLEELKNIQPGGMPSALDEVMRLQPFWYAWNQKTHPTSDRNSQPGLGAHATEKVDRRLVTYDAKGKLKGVRYEQLTAVLVAAVQQQQREIYGLFGVCAGLVLAFFAQMLLLVRRA